MEKTFNIHDEIDSAYGFVSDEALTIGQKVYAYLAENKNHKAVLDFSGMKEVSPPFMIDLIDLCYEAGWKDRLSLIENSSEYITIMYEYAWRTIELLKSPRIASEQPQRNLIININIYVKGETVKHSLSSKSSISSNFQYACL